MIKDDIKILSNFKDEVIHSLKMAFGEEYTNDVGEVFDIDNNSKEKLSHFITPNYYKAGCLFVVYLLQQLGLENKSKEYVYTYHILQKYLDKRFEYMSNCYNLLESYQRNVFHDDEFTLTYYEIQEYSYVSKKYSIILGVDDYKKFLRNEKLKEIIE